MSCLSVGGLLFLNYSPGEHLGRATCARARFGGFMCETRFVLHEPVVSLLPVTPGNGKCCESARAGPPL